MHELLAELVRQFPVVALTLGLAFYFFRYVTRQHERELAAKNQEIARILEEKQKELDRLLEERRKYFQLFLKEVEALMKKPKDGDSDAPGRPVAR